MYCQAESSGTQMATDNVLSVANLLKEAGYPESEIANIRRIISEYTEALDDILIGLEMDINETKSPHYR